MRAHRAAWELSVGTIPDGLQVLHVCDNRKCVRPDHLFLGTNQDNMADKVAKRRQATNGRKLTWEAVEEIRAAPLSGASRQAFADKFGVHPRTIESAAKGRYWARTWAT